MSQRTLFIHTGGIGDFILTFPAIEVLSQEGPIEIAGIPERAALAVRAGLADAVHDLDAIKFHTIFTEPDESLCAFLSKFDRVFLCMRSIDVAADAIRACGVGDVLNVDGVPPDDWPHHASRWFLRAVGIDKERPSRLLKVGEGERAHDVVIHAGSGGARKNWPMDRFIDLAERLTQSGRAVEWTIGPAEEALELPDAAQIIRPETLIDAANVYAQSKCYIGNDSGMTHLAAAVGTPTIAIFGPTNPHVWAPLGDHVHVVHDADWPAVDTVLNAMTDV